PGTTPLVASLTNRLAAAIWRRCSSVSEREPAPTQSDRDDMKEMRMRQMRHGWSRLVALIAVVAILATTSPLLAQGDAFDPESFDVGLELAAEGFSEPLLATHAGDERLFVVER